MNFPPKDQRYMYGDCLQWPDGYRCELIDGIVCGMTPAQGRIHQKALGALCRKLGNYLENKQSARGSLTGRHIPEAGHPPFRRIRRIAGG